MPINIIRDRELMVHIQPILVVANQNKRIWMEKYIEIDEKLKILRKYGTKIGINLGLKVRCIA